MIHWDDKRLAPFLRDSPILVACHDLERASGIDSSTECVVILSQALQEANNELFKIRMDATLGGVVIPKPITVIYVRLDCEICLPNSTGFERGSLESE